MAQNVKVYCRVRPLLPSEKVDGARSCITIHKESDEINVKPSIRVGDRSWGFDGVFGIDSEQSDVYDVTVAPLVAGCLSGYNATILAYGQTGSGKTFTMGTANPQQIIENHSAEGSGEQTTNRNNESEQIRGNFDQNTLPSTPTSTSTSVNTDGIIPRALFSLFQLIKEKQKNNIKVELKVSYLEILNEEIRDLLAVEPSSKVLAVREDNYRRISVQHSVLASASSPEEMLNLFRQGGSRRTTAGTLMNAASSRSHAIFTVFIDQYGVEEEDKRKHRRVRSKFHLVDLAGSERLLRTGATGSRQRESAAINQGLLALSKVISALTVKLRPDDTRHQHVPYRDSKLTRLLQDSLGGNSATCVVACISPADNSVGETVNTLKYASKARLIVNAPIVNEVEYIEEEDKTLLEENELDMEDDLDKDGVGYRIDEQNYKTRQIKYEEEIKMKLIETQEIFIEMSKQIRALQEQGEAKRTGRVGVGEGGGGGYLNSSTVLQNVLRRAEKGAQLCVPTSTRGQKNNIKNGSRSLKNDDDENLTDKCLKLGWELEEKDKAIQILQQENVLLKEDLSRDEEIFADKLKEIKSLQSEMFLVRKENESLKSSSRNDHSQKNITHKNNESNNDKNDMGWEIEEIDDEYMVNQDKDTQSNKIVEYHGTRQEEKEEGAVISRKQRKKWASPSKKKGNIVPILNENINDYEGEGKENEDDNDDEEDQGEGKADNDYDNTNNVSTRKDTRNRQKRMQVIEKELLNNYNELEKLTHDLGDGEKALKVVNEKEVIIKKQMNEIKIIIAQNENDQNNILNSILRFQDRKKKEIDLLNHLKTQSIMNHNIDNSNNNKNNNNSFDNSFEETETIKHKNEEKINEIIICIEKHENEINHLEVSGEEASRLVLRYRNRVVALQQEVASLRADLLKESDAKLQQTSANTSRTEVALSKQRVAKLRDLLSMRTMELRTLALQENEQKNVLKLKKNSDTRILTLKHEIQSFNLQKAQLEEEIINASTSLNEASSSPQNKVLNIHNNIQKCQINIETYDNEISLYENKKESMIAKMKILQNNLYAKEEDYKQNHKVKQLTINACIVVKDAINNMNENIDNLKNELYDLKIKEEKEEEENIRKNNKTNNINIENNKIIKRRRNKNQYVSNNQEFKQKEHDDDNDISEEKQDIYGGEMKEHKFNNSYHNNQIHKNNETQKNNNDKDIELWFNKQLEQAELSILEARQHARDVELHERAINKHRKLEHARCRALKSQSQSMELQETDQKDNFKGKNMIELASSLEEIDSTIKALDTQVAIPTKQHHEKKIINQASPSSSSSSSLSLSQKQKQPCQHQHDKKSLNMLSNKLEELSLQREEAIERRSAIKQEMNQSENDGDQIQQINDELFALEAEIELKDMEIRKWKEDTPKTTFVEFSESSFIKTQVQKMINLFRYSNNNDDNNDNKYDDDDENYDNDNDEKLVLLKKCLKYSSEACLTSRLAYRGVKLMNEDLQSKLTNCETSYTSTKFALQSEKDMNEELNRKLKSVSFNLRRMRNERNQLRAFIHTTTPPSSSSSPMKPLSNNLQEEMLEVQHAQEIEFNNNTRESSSGHGSSSNDQIKFKNGQKSGSGSRLNNQGNSGTINDKHSLQKVRLSVKDLKEVIHISQPPPKKQQPSEPSQQQEQEKMNTSSLLPSHHQKSFIKNNSFPSKDNVIPPHVGSAPSPPIRVAPPRPPSYSSF